MKRHTSESLAEMTTAEVVEAYNALPGVTQVKRFESHAIGVKRYLSASGAAEVPQAQPSAVSVAKPARKAAEPQPVSEPRKGTVKALVIALASRPCGVALETVMTKTGWARHTTRGFFSVLGGIKGKPAQYNVERTLDSKGRHTYRIA